jgi:hypothetical protein
VSIEITLTSDGSLGLETVHSWLAGRAHWSVESRQGIYENGDTDVHMVLDLDVGRQGEAVLTAVLNLYRPSFFIAELEHEISHLVEDLGLRREVQGPDGPSTLDYSADDLVSEWHESNAVAHRALWGADPDPLHADREVLDRVWRWNAARWSTQDELGDEIFVPRLTGVINDRSVVRTGVVWADAIPTAFPDCDLVIVFRSAPRRRRVFGRGKTATALYSRDSIVRLLTEADAAHIEADGLVVSHASAALTEWVSRLPSAAAAFRTTSWDRVHDRELTG